MGEKGCFNRSKWQLSADDQEVNEMKMDNWTFGITMLVVGMGGTVLTLWILSLIMSLLKKAFPYTKEEAGK